MSTSSSSEVAEPTKQRRWGRGLLVNLTLSLCSLLLFVALVEMTLRFMGYGNVEIYQADPIVYWRLKPDQDCYTKVNHQPVHINSQGTRGREFEAKKPANTLRILSLGDSRTFGWGLHETQTYTGVLETRLQAHFGGKKSVEVINAGVNAWSFPQMAVYFREYGLKFNPDYVIVGDANFWTQFSEQNSPEFVQKFLLRVKLKNLLRRFALYHYVVEVQLARVYEKYRVKFVPVDPAQDNLFNEQQQKDPDAFFRNAIEGLCTVALSNSVTPILIYLPTEDEDNRPIQKNLRNAKAQLGEKLQVPFVDLTPQLKVTGKTLYLEADPIHFNAEGSEIIGNRLFQTLTNLTAK